MTRMLLTDETRQKIRELKPMVDALNALQAAYEIASSHYGDALDTLPDDAEPHHMDEVFDESARDLANDTSDTLCTGITNIASHYGMRLYFNRVDGQFVLLDRAK